MDGTPSVGELNVNCSSGVDAACVDETTKLDIITTRTEAIILFM
jgi:hypothetical protein